MFIGSNFSVAQKIVAENDGNTGAAGEDGYAAAAGGDITCNVGGAQNSRSGSSRGTNNFGFSLLIL